jgi:hypothetical protein
MMMMMMMMMMMITTTTTIITITNNNNNNNKITLQLGPVLFHLIKVCDSWPQLCSMNAAYKRVDRQFGIADKKIRIALTQRVTQSCHTKAWWKSLPPILLRQSYTANQSYLF